MGIPEWDEDLETSLFELPAELLELFEPGELAQVDQLIAEAKSQGSRVLRTGGTIVEAIQRMRPSLKRLGDLTELVIQRYRDRDDT